jgi:hypothetical protein
MQQQRQQQQQHFCDHHDEGSIDLKSNTGFLFSKQLNLDQVPDAIECSFTSWMMIIPIMATLKFAVQP